MNQSKLPPYRDDLSVRLSGLIAVDRPTAFFLEGGHFDPRFGVTSFARQTLTDALDVAGELIKRFSRRVRIVLGILVDDLGLDCGDGGCTTSSVTADSPAGTLPRALESILTASRFVKRERLLVSSERNAKNRGIARLKRMLSASEITSRDGRDGSSLTYRGGLRQERHHDTRRITFNAGRDVLLAEVRGESWSIKCPMIMAQHYLDVFSKLRQRYPADPRLVLVDWSEMLDQPNVVAGAEIAVRMAGENGAVDVVNTFFGDDKGDIYRFHHASGARSRNAEGSS